MSDEKILLILNTVKKVSIIVALIGSAIIKYNNIDNTQIDENNFI